jgi:hypothetical protein
MDRNSKSAIVTTSPRKEGGRTHQGQYRDIESDEGRHEGFISSSKARQTGRRDIKSVEDRIEAEHPVAKKMEQNTKVAEILKVAKDGR